MLPPSGGAGRNGIRLPAVENAIITDNIYRTTVGRNRKSLSDLYSIRGEQNSMPEVPHPGKYRGDAQSIGGVGDRLSPYHAVRWIPQFSPLKPVGPPATPKNSMKAAEFLRIISHSWRTLSIGTICHDSKINPRIDPVEAISPPARSPSKGKKQRTNRPYPTPLPCGGRFSRHRVSLT